jgi:hypothetical protein
LPAVHAKQDRHPRSKSIVFVALAAGSSTEIYAMYTRLRKLPSFEFGGNMTA